MTRTRLAACAFLLAALGCRGCRRELPGAATTGANAPLPRQAALVDAGPQIPWKRVANKLAPLPRQANLAQIFVGFDHGAAPWMPPKAKKRTLAEAKSLAEQLATDARRGADFDALAKKESEWPLADRNGSLLGVQTEGGPSMLGEFDNQIFKLKVNEVSEPLQSALGFHILKRLPVVHVAHIFIGIHDGHAGPPARTRDEARALAEKIVQEVSAPGASFGAAAFAQSDDLTSAGRDGDLGVLDPRTAKTSPVYQAGERMQVGAISSPVSTPGGYEVLKRLE